MAEQKVTYRLHRTVAVGDIPDDDPRVTPPTEPLFKMEQVVNAQGNSNKDVDGHALFIRCLDAGGAEVVAATIDFTTWIKDEGSGKFFSLRPVLAAESSRNFSVHANGPIFVALDAINAAGATATVEIRIVERASVL